MRRLRVLSGPAAAALVVGLAPWARRAFAPPAAASGPGAVDPPFRFVESSRESGLSFEHQRGRTHPSLAHLGRRLTGVGAFVAVADYDRDGHMDVLVAGRGSGARAALFRNRGDGRFDDVAARVGLDSAARERGIARALFFEADGDGRPDLFLSVFGRAPRLLLNRREGFRPAPSTFRSGTVYAANALDLDGDGDLDLVLGYNRGRALDLEDPGHYDFMDMSIALAGVDPGPIEVLRNEGGGRFRPDARGPANEVGFLHALGV